MKIGSDPPATDVGLSTGVSRRGGWVADRSDCLELPLLALRRRGARGRRPLSPNDGRHAEPG
jgi:hypothetical protein